MEYSVQLEKWILSYQSQSVPQNPYSPTIAEMKELEKGSLKVRVRIPERLEVVNAQAKFLQMSEIGKNLAIANSNRHRFVAAAKAEEEAIRQSSSGRADCVP